MKWCWWRKGQKTQDITWDEAYVTVQYLIDNIEALKCENTQLKAKLAMSSHKRGSDGRFVKVAK